MSSVDDMLHRVGAAVRAARSRAGFSRRRLAESADVSERYLNELEKGAANPSIGVLTRIAGALGATPAELVSDPALPDQRQDALSALVMALPREQRDLVAQHLATYLGEKRKSLKGLALIGLRGAGKSTLGRRLAEKRGLPFVSMTGEIEARAGMSLADLFNLGGAESYRALETEVAEELAARKDRIILETGGGITLNAPAFGAVLAGFRTVWLRALPEDHLARVARQGDTRPMDGNPRALDHLKALLAAREPDYAKADGVIDTSGKSEADCLAALEAFVALPG